MSTTFVRAAGAYRFNRDGRALRIARGDVLPADHWTVRQASDPSWFEPVELDSATGALVAARMAAAEELAEITARNTGGIGSWPEGQAERFRRTQTREAGLAEQIAAEVKRRDQFRELAANPAGIDPARLESGDGAPVGARSGSTGSGSVAGSGILGGAHRLVDTEHRAGRLPSHAAARVDTLIRSGVPEDGHGAARWVLATGREAYRSAFAKLCADPERGHLLWSAEEGAAFRAVAALQAEMHRGESRAMGGGTGAGGGFLVPFQLDPAILLTSNGSTNPLRRISRVEQTVGSVWHGVTSAGAVAEWKAEHAEVADASPTLDQPGIPVHFGDAFVPYSFEVGMDAVNFLGQLSGVLVDAADQLQAAAFMTGSGTGRPKGLLTALPSGSKVPAKTADTLSIGDPVALQNALPPRFQPNAQFVANLATLNAIGSFETANGALRYPETGSGRLLNRPLSEASHMATAGATTGAGNDAVLLYGDFQQFLIVDRIGTTIELVPHLFGANHRPTGQRGALLWFRTGSDVLIGNAFRVLTA